MKSLYTFLPMAMLCAVAWLIYPTGVTPERQEQPRNDTSVNPLQAKAGSEAEPADQPEQPGPSATIEALQAQLEQTARTSQRLLLRGALTPPPRPEARDEQDRETVESAARALDGRLFDAPQDEAEVARLESALEAITGRLPEDVSTEVACAATLCRVVIRAHGDAIGRATHQVARDMPKLFTATVVLPTADGESTMYLARDPALLEYSSAASTDL